jgi:uncharacterized protein (TIGR02284 family)
MRSHTVYDDDLKDVIKRNLDAVKGYEKAADKVQHAELAKAFRDQASQRRQFALELQGQTHVLDDSMVNDIKDGSFKGDMHRTWMDIKTALSSDKDEALVEECIRGEKAALEDYDDLLEEKEITGPERTLIMEQRNTVEACIQDLKRIENTLD